MWGQHTNLAMAEYWRWWVVHLWVEGFFEVFATVVMAFLFTRMGLLGLRTATASVLFSPLFSYLVELSVHSTIYILVEHQRESSHSEQHLVHLKSFHLC